MYNDDEITLEIPNFRGRAQALLQLLFGSELSAVDYREKMEVIEQEMRELFDLAHQTAKIQYESMRKSTVPPPSQYPESHSERSVKRTQALRRKSIRPPK